MVTRGVYRVGFIDINDMYNNDVGKGDPFSNGVMKDSERAVSQSASHVRLTSRTLHTHKEHLSLVHATRGRPYSETTSLALIARCSLLKGARGLYGQRLDE